MPATCPCLQPDQSNPHLLSCFLKIHFNIILPLRPGLDSPSTSRACKWSFSSGLLTTSEYASLMSHMFTKIISTSNDYDHPVYSLCFNTRLLLICKAMNYYEFTGYEPSFTPPQTTNNRSTVLCILNLYFETTN